MGNETRFSQEIPVNASLLAVYIHHVVRDMTYRIQVSAVNTVGDGPRSDAIVVGEKSSSRTNLRTGRVATSRDRPSRSRRAQSFNRIGQVAPVCTPI